MASWPIGSELLKQEIKKQKLFWPIIVNRTSNVPKIALIGFSLILFFSSCGPKTTPKAQREIKTYSKDDNPCQHLINQKRFQEALDCMNDLKGQDEQGKNVRAQHAILLSRNKKYIEAYNLFNNIISNEPDLSSSIYYEGANVAWRLKKFQKAKLWSEKYIANTGDKAKYLPQCHYMVNSADTATYLVDHPLTFELKPMGRSINSNERELGPITSINDSLLVFTRIVDGQEDFMVSRRLETDWEIAQPLLDINTRQNEGAHTLSADGKVLIFTACNRRDGLGSCDLYMSKRQGNKWSTPVNLGENINSKYWDSQPTLSASGDQLIFASNRPDGRGGKDLWICRVENGKWTRPENLGERINTSQDEENPFLHADGQTLYFSSNGLPGMGGKDIFMSQRLSENAWTGPKNLGYPLNGMEDEQSLFIDWKGQFAYFASSRRGNADIFRFLVDESIRPTPIHYVYIKVFDASTKEEIPNAKVYISDQNTRKAYLTDRSGEKVVILKKGKTYGIQLEKTGYIAGSYRVSSDQKNNELSFYLEPEKDLFTLEKPIVFHNILFESGSAKLLPSSAKEIDVILKVMQDKKDAQLLIEGHTDDVGTDADNLILSKNRADAVKAYLVKNGIETNRIKTVGKGESEHIVTNDSEVNRQLNRRTTFYLKKI